MFSERPAGAKKTPYFPYIKKEKSNSFPDLKSQGVSLKEKMYFVQRFGISEVCQNSFKNQLVLANLGEEILHSLDSLYCKISEPDMPCAM